MSARAQLETDGFVVLPGVIPAVAIERLDRATAPWIEQMPRATATLLRYQGSDIPVHAMPDRDRVFAELWCDGVVDREFASLGFAPPRLLSAYVVSKPARSPALFWHQDWPFWDSPYSASTTPAMVGVMIYLADTHRTNGCLRVLPGSHRRRLRLHANLPTPHSMDAYRQPEGGPAFAAQPTEVDVAVRAGDAVLVDARLLHASWPNASLLRRTCITLWCLPGFDALPEPLQAAFNNLEADARFRSDDAELGHRVPAYRGSARPAAFERTPGEYLRDA